MKLLSFISSIFFLAAAISGCESAKPASEERTCVPAAEAGIVNGRALGPSDPLSKKVALIMSSTGSSGSMQICTGTPIAKDLILTAAHCVEDAKENKILVSFHTDITCESGFNIKDSERVIKAKGFVINPSYSTYTIKNDLALIKLEKDIPSDYEVSELFDGVETLTSDQITFAGYGKTSENRNDSTFLRTTAKSKAYDAEVKGPELSWMQSYSGVCQGDSGGPVFFDIGGKLKVAGVVSAVSGTSESTVCHGRGRSMYVPYYLQWIRETQIALSQKDI